jgi:hypothetical protein
MATKAERFRYAEQRSGEPRPPTGQRRRGPSHGRKAAFAFESSAPGPASRKSTRKAKNRQKAGTALKARKTLETTAPRSQHERGRRAK